MVAGGDDHQQYERRVERPERANESSSSVPEQADGDDQRVTDVHARDGRVRVVERADEPVVQVHMPVRDGVGDADPGQPRWRGRIPEKADERERAGDEQCRADKRKRRRATLMQPETNDGRHCQLNRQLGHAEHPRETRQRVCSVLHPSFDEEMQEPLERNELVGMTVRFLGVADDKAARQLVDAVQGEDERCFEA